MDAAAVPSAWGAPGLGLEIDRFPFTSVIASDLKRSDVGLVDKVKVPVVHVFILFTFHLEGRYLLQDKILLSAFDIFLDFLPEL